MRELLDIVSETQLNEATYDKELDKIVAKVLRGSAGFSKGKMIDRDLVLNKGFNMATKLDNTRDKDKLSLGNLLGKIKDFVVTDDFLERQYFGKIAKRLRLDGMFMNDGNFVTTDVDEFDRYQSGSGSAEDAERQNNMGILPGKIAKKFNIKLKMKGAADDAMDKDSPPAKEYRLQNNGSRVNFNIKKDQPYVDEIEDGKKIRTYGTVELLKARFGKDADIQGAGMAAKADAGKKADAPSNIKLDDAKKKLKRFKELLAKAEADLKQKSEAWRPKSLADQLLEQYFLAEALTDDEADELAQLAKELGSVPEFGDDVDDEISDALNKHGTWLQNYKKSFSIKTPAQDIDIPGVSFPSDGPADTMQGDPALYDPNYADDAQATDKTAKDIDKDVYGDPALYDPNYADDAQATDPADKKLADFEKGELLKFSKSGKKGLANDADEVGAIKELQNRLKEVGIDITVSGKYDRATVDAVKQFQEMLGTKQDGDAGPNTIGAIMKLGNAPKAYTYYSQLKRVIELQKKAKGTTAGESIRYFSNVIQGVLFEALSDAEQKELNDLLTGLKSVLEDPEYQANLPKPMTDLIGQVDMSQMPKGAETGAAQTADELFKGYKGRFIPVPDELKSELGLDERPYFIDAKTQDGMIFILADPVGKINPRVDPKKLVRNIKQSFGVSDRQGTLITDYLNKNNIPYNDDIPGTLKDGPTAMGAKSDTAKSADAGGDDTEGGVGGEEGEVSDVTPDDAKGEAVYKVVSGSGQGRNFKSFDANGNVIDQGRGGGPNLPDEETYKKSVASNTDTAKSTDASGEVDAETVPKALAGDPIEQATALNVAMKGEGLLGKFSRAVSTDEDAIFKVFQKINSQAEYDAVANAYRKKYGADLYSAIKGELSPKEEFKGPDGQVMGTAQTLIFDKIDNKFAGAPKDATPTSAKTDDKGAYTVSSDGTILRQQPDGSFKPEKKADATTTTTPVYTVKSGDTLGKIAQANNTTVDAIVKANPEITNANQISVNQKIKIPGVTSSAQANQASADTAMGANTTTANKADQKSNVKPVEPRPANQSGRNRLQDKWDKKYGQTHNPDGSPKTESKEYDMTKVNEAASMNISMSGDNAGEVSELVSILRNAGMQDAKPVTPDMMPPMAKTISMVDEPHDHGAPCGEDVDEEWDNSPDEEYKDDDYINQDLAGGLNRPKDKGALRVKDPAVHNEEVEKYKKQLANDLLQAYGK